MGKLVRNSLGFDSNLFVYQDKDMFNYSVDTILLGNFFSIDKKTLNVLEVGTNNGALSIFIASRYKKMKIDAIEIQEEATELAKKNIELNNLQNQITPINIDFFDLVKDHTKNQKQKYDAIVCNPPFYKVDSSIKRKGNDSLYIATHEVKINLEDLIKESARIIKQKGYLTIVLPTERIVDAFEYMRKYGFEPKRVKMVHPREHVKSNLVLIESRFKVGWGVHFQKNIYLHTNDETEHEYREEVKELYKPKIFKGDKDE